MEKQARGRKRTRTEDDEDKAESKAETKERRRKLFQREVKEFTDDEQFPMPSKKDGNAFLVGIAGRRKSGKTFLLDAIMKTMWLGLFDQIHVLSKTAKYQDYFKTWAGNIRYVEEWDPYFFHRLIADMKNNPKKHSLVIIDDMSSRMRERLYATNIDEFAFIGRHFRISVVWLAQKITLFTPGFRQEADGFILFREENMPELRMLHREWGFGDMDDFIIKLVENIPKRFDWLMIRNEGGTTQIYKPPSSESDSESEDFVSATESEDDDKHAKKTKSE